MPPKRKLIGRSTSEARKKKALRASETDEQRDRSNARRVMDKEKIVSDAIFGFITLKPYILAIIDTPQFQRLRSIWQLGLTPFVYPTANHSRFEHSIGTYWIASKLIRKLKQQISEMVGINYVISDKDVRCVEIAALCHDIGHGPFSHFWDNTVLPKFKKGKKVGHERQFKKMWTILKKNKKVKEMIKTFRINKKDENLIDAIINGRKVKGKELLCSIVNNSESGMDVDKWDYLARDAAYLGHSTTNYRVDIERMIHLSRAINESGKWKIAFRDTESLNMLRVFELRYYMHKTAYRHRVVIGIELMMLDGVGRCITDKIISSQEIGNEEWLLQNTDALFWSNFGKIKEFQLILERDLYKPLIEVVKYEIVSDPTKEITEYLNRENLSTNCLRVAFCKFNLSKDVSNPILSIPFYKKGGDSIFRYTTKNLPLNLNLKCDESRVIVFSTHTSQVTCDCYKDGQMKKKLEEYFTDPWIIQ